MSRQASVPASPHGADALVAETPAALARTRTFHTLDALRGVAALVVLVFHGGFFFGVPRPAEGHLAVDLFFAMSGFVIAYRYEDDLARGLGLRGFLALRLSRLYPLFLLATCLGLVPALVAVASGHADRLHEGMLASFPLALLMLPSHAIAFARAELYPLNLVSWSLALELLVNLAWAATHRVWSLRNLAWLLCAAFLGLCAAAAVHGSLDVGHDWDNVAGGVPRVVFGFGIGVLLYRLRDARRVAPRVPWWTLVLLVPALLYVDPSRFGPAWLRPVFDVAFVAVVVPLILRAAVASEPPRALQGLCALAGIFSYVVYSLHVVFIGLYLRIEDRLHYDLATTSPSRGAAFLVALAALCWVAHVAYDKPIRRRLALRRAPGRRLALAAGRG